MSAKFFGTIVKFWYPSKWWLEHKIMKWRLVRVEVSNASSPCTHALEQMVESSSQAHSDIKLLQRTSSIDSTTSRTRCWRQSGALGGRSTLYLPISQQAPFKITAGRTGAERLVFDQNLMKFMICEKYKIIHINLLHTVLQPRQDYPDLEKFLQANELWKAHNRMNGFRILPSYIERDVERLDLSCTILG